jgi:amino acid transporter
MGQWVARYVGLSMFLALSGAFFTLTYAPLKQMIDGTPAKLWPGKLGITRESDGMPVNAMWVQCIIVVVMIFATSVVGGKSMAKFFDILVAMTNVAMTIPYMFLAIAYISFKKRDSIKKPFEVFKTYKSALIWGVIITLTVGFANVFSIIEPVISAHIQGAVGADLSDAWVNTIAQVAGPILFGVIAVYFLTNSQNNLS